MGPMRVGRWASCLFVACSGPAATPDAANPCIGVPAAEVLATEPQQLPSDLALDDQFVYWTNFHGDAIRRTPKARGSAETVASDAAPQFIAVDDTDIYWMNGSGDVMRLRKSAGSFDVLATGPGCGDSYPCGEALVLDDEAIYWAELGAPGKIMRLAKSGGTVVALEAQGLMTETLAVDAAHIYFGALVYDGALHHALRRMPKTGGAADTLIVFDEPFFSGIALDLTYVYVARADGIWRIAKDGTDSVHLAEAAMSRRVAVDRNSIYVTRSSTLERIAIDGSSAETVACDQRSAWNLAVDDTRIYWNDPSAGTINVMPK